MVWFPGPNHRGGVKPPKPARSGKPRDGLVTTLPDLHAHYGTPSAPAVVKVTPHLTPSDRALLDRSRFCVLTTVGPEGRPSTLRQRHPR